MIWTYDMSRGKRRPSLIEETGGQNNYYSPIGADGERVDGIDDLLTAIEGKAVAGYDLLLQGRIPEGQVRADFSAFVATLYTRSPRLLNGAAAMYGRMAQFVLNMTWRNRAAFERSIDAFEAKEGPIRITRDELWEFHQDPDRYTLSVHRQWALPVLGAADKIQRILFERRWHVIPAFGRDFITSDSPVFRHAPRTEFHAIYGDGGFLNPSAEITLPLSPRMMLLITDAAIGDLCVADPATVQLANELRAYSAHRLIFAHQDSTEVADLAERFKDEGPTWAADFAGPMPEVEVSSR